MIAAIVILGALCGFLFVWNLGLSGAVSDLSQRLRKQEAAMTIVANQASRTAIIVSLEHQEHGDYLSTQNIITDLYPELVQPITTPHGPN